MGEMYLAKTVPRPFVEFPGIRAETNGRHRPDSTIGCTFSGALMMNKSAARAVERFWDANSEEALELEPEQLAGKAVVSEEWLKDNGAN